VKNTVQEVVTGPAAQVVVGSTGIAAALTSIMGYIESGAAVIALVGGAVIVVFTAMHGYKRLQHDKLETKKLALEVEALERAKKESPSP